jgi:hypothetical protein
MFAAIRRASSRVSSFCDSYFAARDGKMMRVLLTVTAIAFLIGVFPAFAQSGGAVRIGVALIVAVAMIKPAIRNRIITNLLGCAINSFIAVSRYSF